MMPDTASMIRTTAAVQIQAADDGGEKPARAIIAAYNGGVMTVPGWGSLVIDLAGLDAADSVPLLADHNSRLEGIVGHGRPVIADGRLVVEGTIDRDTDRGKRIISLARSGFSFQASVGVKPDRGEFVPQSRTIQANGQTITAPRGGMKVFRGGKLREVSITALGADDSTSVNIQGRKTMADKTNGQDGGEQFGEGVDPDPIVQARAEERERIAEIDKIVTHAGNIDDLRAGAIDGTIPVKELNETALMRLRASRGSGPAIRSRSSAGFDEGKLLEASLLVRAGFAEAAVKSFGEQVVERAERQPLSLKDVVGIQASGVSSISTPNILSNTANKVAAAAYNLTPSTWTGFASIKNVRDFKPSGSVRLNVLGQLEQVAPDGELKHASFGDEKYNFQAATFGKIAALSRQDIINDDLQLFSDVIPHLARMARRTLDDEVYKAIFAAVDGGTFYKTANGNKLAAGSALDSTSLGKAVESMRKQTGPNGESINIVPKVLVVSPANEMTARAILSSVEVGAGAGVPSGNPLRDIVGLEVEPRIGTSTIGNGDAKNWFLFAGPMDLPFIVAYVGGSRFPVVETSDSDFNTLGTQFRVYMDFGVAAADPKASVYATGASS